MSQFSHFGRYQIIDFIGDGGAGRVFKAFDPVVKREVAIKMLTTNSADYRTRFYQEAEVLAKLEHPNIVPIYDFGEQDGNPYIVMRLMSGGTLHDRLQQNRLTYEEIVKIITLIASALDYAHEIGIVHRDIKPGNILFDTRGEPQIVDFGLSKIFNDTNNFNLTRANLVGTPYYMSPEQSDGKALNHLTDVYSLAVILFQICNGRVPYHAESQLTILYKHINEPVPDMPHLPRSIIDVIKNGMAKAPADRYQSAGALATAFEKGVEQINAEVPAQQATVIGQTTALFKNKPRMAYGGLASVLAIFGAIFFLFTAGGSPGLQLTPTIGAVIGTTAVDTAVASPSATSPPTRQPTEDPGPTSTAIQIPTLLPESTKGIFSVTSSNAAIYTGPSTTGFEEIDLPIDEGQAFDLVATNRSRTWVLVALSTGFTGWMPATSGEIEGIDLADIEPALTEPAPATATLGALPPTATSISRPTSTSRPATATPTQPPATLRPTSPPPPPPTQPNPFDLDGDGVLHNPDEGLFDLCQDAVGNPGTCGCPADQIPSACGGSSGSGGGGPTPEAP